MNLGVLGIASLLLLTGCAGSSDSACESLNAEWNRNVLLLDQLPSAFSNMTKEEGIKWSALIDAKRAIEDQMDSLENCVVEYKFSG